MAFDEQTILQTLMSWRNRISAAAWVVVRDTHAAEDIFQNVALKALTKDVTFESEAALRSWAFITARREGIDWLRKHKHETACLDESILSILENSWEGESTVNAGGRVEALRECLNSVPEQSRHLLKLRYFDGYSCEEVAKQLGAGLTAIYKRVSRLHHSLKDCVEARLARSNQQPT
jgi:RNA polymerase sigma-70 factor (ECF subfamily)